MDRKTEQRRLYSMVQVPLEMAVRASLNLTSTISTQYDPEKFGRIQQAAGIIGDAFNAIGEEKLPLDRARAELKDRLPALAAIAREFDGPSQAELVRQLTDAQARLSETLDAERQR